MTLMIVKRKRVFRLKWTVGTSELRGELSSPSRAVEDGDEHGLASERLKGGGGLRQMMNDGFSVGGGL